MSQTVAADAQFGIARILRPYAGFDNLTPGNGSYQGISTNIPIMLTEGGLALDPFAGQAGYAPSLVRGLGVPLGSRVSIWVPSIPPNNGGVAPFGYVYSAIWRLRNLHDYAVGRIPYHYPKQGSGVPVVGSARVVIPAASQSVIYNDGPAPTTLGGAATQSVYAEALTFNFSVNAGLGIPLIPGGTSGSVAQGLAPSDQEGAVYEIIELQALGDELLIGVTRSGAGTWDFTPSTGIDATLSAAYGNGLDGTLFPDIGVYVMVGTTP